MSLAIKVRELRQKLGWNQATLAQKSGITQATISRIEAGRVTQPKMRILHRLAGTLGTTIDYLAGDSTQMSFDDLMRDNQARVVFRGWGKLSAADKEQLARLVRFFEQEASKGEKDQEE
ncbi:MAG: helix-turn-helix transcriptional regulator [Chloroflexi bacterium]|nr:helix-turn-helix transcriptional regulator [Chloroflexota bacterium]